ncbi:hypothetical protein M406DRAFT_109359 [Cryphonectria parasitica EP155]|uniref:Uncharacterized protein n=1 Tax=Cryphonectria parasitica (strain ATCC 38755 / EP155) TaxID=660469 RepID=A0A9P4YAB4_CRYP1|nr:uncharacterized protein M406DRAFT_109359 [Cryphonectria parasitica EP155]KAF3769319.1 hypothetical protein M406DRAFT_109359 [Cryphonectria parasitica EP155]
MDQSIPYSRLCHGVTALQPAALYKAALLPSTTSNLNLFHMPIHTDTVFVHPNQPQATPPNSSHKHHDKDMSQETSNGPEDGLRGTGDAPRRGTVVGTDRPTFDLIQDQSHTERSTELPNPRKPDEVHVQHDRDARHRDGRRIAPSTLPPIRHAQNYDEAQPGQPGPDFSEDRPAFNRGKSVIDNTALVSAGPTPAFEVSNPMASAFVKGTGGSRQRESHLPDLDIRDADVYGSDKEAFEMEEPKDEINGQDEFAPTLSRQETEKGTGDLDRF